MARIRSPFTDAFNLSVPVVGCPMAGCAGPELAAAVAQAGGLGFLGSGEHTSNVFLKSESDCYESNQQVRQKLLNGLSVVRIWSTSCVLRTHHLVLVHHICSAAGCSSAEKINTDYQEAVKAAGSKGVIGIGLLNFYIKNDMLEATIACKPHSVWLAVGDFKPFIKRLKQAGSQTIAVKKRWYNLHAIPAAALQSMSIIEATPMLAAWVGSLWSSALNSDSGIFSSILSSVNAISSSER